MCWRNIGGLVGATSKDKYRLQWHALCPLLGREHCAIRSRAKFTSTAYEIIVNSSVPVSSRLVSARSCISTSSVTSFSFVRISATGYLLSSLSYLVSRYTAEAHRTGRYQGFNLSACGYILFISAAGKEPSHLQQKRSPILILFFLFLNYLLINGTNPISVQTWKNKSLISVRANVNNNIAYK